MANATLPNGTAYTYEALTSQTIEDHATIDARGITVKLEDEHGNVTELWLTTTAARRLADLAEQV